MQVKEVQTVQRAAYFKKVFLNVSSHNHCVNFFAAFYFAGFFQFGIPRELIFADQGQSAKSAKIRTRKIFMLHGSGFTVLLNSILQFITDNIRPAWGTN